MSGDRGWSIESSLILSLILQFSFDSYPHGEAVGRACGIVENYILSFGLINQLLDTPVFF